jgi:hypothetical protein
MRGYNKNDDIFIKKETRYIKLLRFFIAWPVIPSFFSGVSQPKDILNMTRNSLVHIQKGELDYKRIVNSEFKYFSAFSILFQILILIRYFYKCRGDSS